MSWWHRFVRNEVKSEPADEATCAAALGRIIEHPASTLAPRAPLTADQLDALDDDDRRAYQKLAADAQKSLGDVKLPRVRGRFDHAASEATLDFNSNSIGLT